MLILQMLICRAVCNNCTGMGTGNPTVPEALPMLHSTRRSDQSSKQLNSSITRPKGKPSYLGHFSTQLLHLKQSTAGRTASFLAPSYTYSARRENHEVVCRSSQISEEIVSKGRRACLAGSAVFTFSYAHHTHKRGSLTVSRLSRIGKPSARLKTS